MKIIFVCAFLLLMYFSICNGTPEKFDIMRIRQKGPSFRQNRGSYVNIAKLPGIVCYYAKNGHWPDYPIRLRELVYRFARFIFSMSDESIRFYCRKLNDGGKTTRRPFFSLTTMRSPPDERPSRVPTTTRRFSTSTTRFTTSTTRMPSTTTRMPSTTTRMPSTTSRIPSTTSRIPSTTSTTTTLSTAEPGTGTGEGTATGTGTGTGTGTASASATGTATGDATNTTSNLAMPFVMKKTKSFKLNEHDIVVPFPMNRQRLRQISF